jgi:tripartite ATP-independent transporter DctM subunit
MEPLTAGIFALFALVVMLALGVPVAVALGLTGFAGLTLSADVNFALATCRTLPYSAFSNYTWAVLPLFVLMGSFASQSRITVDVFEAARLWLVRIRGGMYLAVIAGSAMFAAAGGSTIVNAVVFTRLALPRMADAGYSRALSAGCITAAGTFAAMIPPSLTFVIYAMLTEQSVGRLLIAGIIPGLISAALYASTVLILVRVRPALAPEPPDKSPPFTQRLAALKGVWGIALLVVIVLGGLYAGIFPPSGAGAAGAFGAFILAAVKLGLKRKWLSDCLSDSASVACRLFAIILGGLVFSRFLAVSGAIDALTSAMTGFIETPLALVISLSVLYLVLGCFIDTASMMIITLPVVYPLISKFGIDPIWFGVVFVKLIEIAVITPPVGLNLFAALSAADGRANYRDITKGVLPFLAADAVTLALLIAYPALSTWLPETMFG